MKLLSISACALALASCTAAGVSPSPSMLAPAAEAMAPDGKPTLTVAAGACKIESCTNAAVSFRGKQIGTLSYSIALGNGGYFGNTTFGGTLAYRSGSYGDFRGTFTDVGTVTSGGVSYSEWQIAGTFAAGTGSLTETFYVRGHSGRGGGMTILNEGGTAIAPSRTPRPSPTPSPLPTPTDG